jgi:hypothetical protein
VKHHASGVPVGERVQFRIALHRGECRIHAVDEVYAQAQALLLVSSEGGLDI